MNVFILLKDLISDFYSTFCIAVAVWGTTQLKNTPTAATDLSSLLWTRIFLFRNLNVSLALVARSW